MMNGWSKEELARLKLVEQLNAAGADVFMTGSRAICPECAKSDADWDFVVYRAGGINSVLADMGFKSEWDEASLDYQINGNLRGASVSWRKDNVNLIVVSNAQAFRRWYEATLLATERVLCKRDERIALFREVIGAPTDEANAD